MSKARILALAAAIIMPAEGLRLILQIFLPSLAITNQINDGIRYICNYCERVCINSTLKKFPNVLNALRCKFMRWLKFAIKVNQSSFPSVFCVSLQANPLKVFSPVICFVSVYVVYTKAILVSGNKSGSNEPMQKNACFNSVLSKTNLSVPSVVTLRRVRLGFSYSRNRLLHSVANSGVLMWPLWGLNSTHITYKKLNTFFSNRFPVFHNHPSESISVGIIGGMT